MMLPPYDTRSTLSRLGGCIDAFKPRRVVALGDSFHRSEFAGRLHEEDRDELSGLQKGREWYWILGNHDPDLPESIGGFVCRSLTIGGITLCHEPSVGRSAEIAGHLHPMARIVRRGEVFRRKCFATDGLRLVMPAFGAYTGGLNVLDEAFSSLFRWHRLRRGSPAGPASIPSRRACCSPTDVFCDDVTRGGRRHRREAPRTPPSARRAVHKRGMAKASM
jgi:DNA ligase-associated metallophosphoesterase